MDWNNPLDPIVTTVEEILSGQRSVLLVMHDEGHGGWQFYDGHDLSDRAPTFVPKDDMLAVDPSLTEVTDLPCGWRAHRLTKGQTWVREPYEQD
jgi:hypothetical protein